MPPRTPPAAHAEPVGWTHRVVLAERSMEMRVTWTLWVWLGAEGDAVGRVEVARSEGQPATAEVTVPRARFEATWRKLERAGALEVRGFEEPQMTDLSDGRLELKWPGGENVIEGYGLGCAEPTRRMCDAVRALVSARVVRRLEREALPES